MLKKYKTEIKWSVIFTITLFGWMLFERLMGWHGENIEEHTSNSLLFLIPAVLVYYAALVDKRGNNPGGSMSWLEGLMSGFHLTIFVVLLTPLAQPVIHLLITPEYFSVMAEHAVESELMAPEEAEDHFSLGSYIYRYMSGLFFMGIVVSAFVAMFARKMPKAPVQDPSQKMDV